MVKAAADEAQKLYRGEHIMMVLLGYFIIAAMAGAAASEIVGFVISDLLIVRFQKADRPLRVPVNQR